MKKKTKIVIFILFFLIVFIFLGFHILTHLGIGTGKKLSLEESIRLKKYSKWIDALEIDNKNVKLVGFNDENDLSTQLRTYKNSDELEKVLEKDTNFVKNNSNYFKKNQKRVLYEKQTSTSHYYFIVSNTFDFNLRHTININLNIPYEQDGTFKLTYMTYRDFLKRRVNKKNTEVLILNIKDFYNTFKSEQSNDKDTEEYKNAFNDYIKNRHLDFSKDLLKEYSSLKHIILITTCEKYNYDLLEKYIKETYPDVTVYIVENNDSIIH